MTSFSKNPVHFQKLRSFIKTPGFSKTPVFYQKNPGFQQKHGFLRTHKNF